jgi:hypothetical protein
MLLRIFATAEMRKRRFQDDGSQLSRKKLLVLAMLT